jgi:hypothetical protein
VVLPRRQKCHASPVDWRDEVLYFLLVDRFSDAGEAARPLLDRADLAAARPALGHGEAWRWDRWAESGANRWQGGTLAGVTSKLDYLKRLGVTTLWLEPGVQAARRTATTFTATACRISSMSIRASARAAIWSRWCRRRMAIGLHVILDIIFNHSGPNWLYPHDTPAARGSRITVLAAMASASG